MEEKSKIKVTWPSVEGPVGIALAVFCAAMTQAAPNFMPLWYVLAFASLSFILDAAWRLILIEKAGYGRLKRAGLVLPVAHAVPTEPTTRHRMVIALIGIGFLAGIRTYTKQTTAKPSISSSAAVLAAPAVPENPNRNTLRADAIELSDELTKFVADEQKVCPDWNNTCRGKRLPRYRALFLKRVKNTVGQLKSRGAISQDQMTELCFTPKDLEWLLACAQRIGSAGRQIPIIP